MNLNFEKDIKPYLLNDKGFYNRRKTESQWLEKHHPEWLQFFNSIITETDNIPEKIYCLDHNYTEIPKCPICGKSLKFKSYTKGYQDYCSRACRFSEEAWKKSEEKQKKTNLERYGVEYTSQAVVKKEKTIQTNLKRYGVTNPNKIKETRDKIKKTVQEKYGTDVYWKSEDFYKKSKITKQKEIIKKWKEKYNLDIVFLNNNIKILNGCNKHGDIELTLNNARNRLYQNIKLCPICNSFEKEGSSYMEIWIKELLDFYNIEYIMRTKDVIAPYELDFYIPSKKLAIECNGVYWHSDIILDDHYYHYKKYNKCKELGISLIQIWEDDFKNKQNIIKDLILTKLTLLNKKIYARNCKLHQIKQIDIISQFYNLNHIQGWNINSSYKSYGLFYNDELVACMTFGPLRKALGQSSEPEVFELYRFAVKQGYSVIGAASKLLSHFKKNNSWKEIITYAKLDYSNGNMYEKIGFEYDSVTPPNYFWVHKNKILRENRFKFRKSEISDESNKHMTEVEIMHSKGYYRCFDAGNLKYIMKNNGR